MSWMTLCSLLLLACALTPILSQTSCRGRCGHEYYRGYLCQCDYGCVVYGECCFDFETECTTKNSCRGRCGESFKRGQLCSCDSDCVKFKQCCPDYKIHCDAEEETVNEAEQQSSTLSGENDEDNNEGPLSPTSFPQDDVNDDLEESPTPESTSGYGSSQAEPLDAFSTQATLITDIPQASTETVPLATTTSEDEVGSTTIDMAESTDSSGATTLPDSGTISSQATTAAEQVSNQPTLASGLEQDPSPTADTTQQETVSSAQTIALTEVASEKTDGTPSFSTAVPNLDATSGPSKEPSTTLAPQGPSQESSTSLVPSPEPSHMSSTSSVPSAEPSQDAYTSSVPSAEPSHESSTSSVPTAEPSQESSTSSMPSAEPSQESSTSSVSSAEPSQESSTSSVPSAEPSQESSTSSMPSAEPSQESSTSSVPSAEPPQESSTSSVPSAEPSQESSTSSVPSAEPSQESFTSSVTSAEPSQESSTSSVSTAEPSQESSTSSMPSAEPSQESSTASVSQNSLQGSSTPSVSPDYLQEHTTFAPEKPTQDSSPEAESSETPIIPDSIKTVPPSGTTTSVSTTGHPSSLPSPENSSTSVSMVSSDSTTTVNPLLTAASQGDSKDEVAPAEPSIAPVTETQKPNSPESSETTSKPQNKPNPFSPLMTAAPVDNIPAVKPGVKPVNAVLTADTARDFQADDNNDTNLCSGRPANAVTTLRNGTIVVFRGHYYWFLDRNRVPGPARDITQAWGVPSPIDTVFTRCNCQGKTYIFKGNQYWRFENNNLDPGYPKVVETGFDGLRGHITAALSVPQYRRRRESVYFFKRGGLVQKYSYQFGASPSCNKKPVYAIYTVRNRVIRQAASLLGPTINIRTAWRGFPTTITSAVSVPSYREPEGYKYYVFSRTKSYNIRLDGERPVVTSPRENPSAQNNNFINCPKTL